MTTIKELDITHIEEIKALYRSVFTSPPWDEDWSDDVQLDEYIRDIMEVRTPVILGLYGDDDNDHHLLGVSIGCIRHWYGGTEYHIEELFIRNDRQNMGYGKRFINHIEEYLKGKGIFQIYLATENTRPAYGFYKKMGFEELTDHVSFFKELNDPGK